MTYKINELRMSHSSSELLDACPRKFEFAKFFLHPKEDMSLAGEAGKCLHTGYQSYFLNRDREQAIFDMMMDYPVQLNSNPNDQRSLETCYATLNAMMDSGLYMEYEVAHINCLDGETRPAVEVPFEIVLPRQQLMLSDGRYIPIRYVGFVDLILYDRMEQEFVVIDIKTTRQNLSDYTALYYFHEQVIPYAIVLERILGHKLDSLKVKYMVVYVDIAKPFIRNISLEKTKQDIDDWARKFLLQIKELQFYAQTEWFKRNPKNCMSWNRVCQFFDMCQSRDTEKLQRRILMDSNPKERPFPNPWVQVELNLES